MALDTASNLLSILASLVTIAVVVAPFLPARAHRPEASAVTAQTSEGAWKPKYTARLLFRWVRVHVLLVILFLLVLVNYATNDSPVKALDVVSISACTGAIIFLLVGCAYKYILWETGKAFDTGESR
ncbi:hypothetical protein [Pseudomonas sp. BF-R-24]|uniref:hypothetical protein n=1 Tax=Pseudomonas sp. BF-R-24 TaxID=2832386 RepID=UPI001CBC69B9|nr:hypothetical protein [Pseudomonas sp. BF-R-24]